MANQRRPFMSYIRQQPLPKYYNYGHVKKVLKDVYGCTLVSVVGYKDRRRFAHYDVVEDATSKVVLKDVTLFQLGSWLEKEGDY